jgi:hypothetical protein
LQESTAAINKIITVVITDVKDTFKI